MGSILKSTTVLVMSDDDDDEGERLTFALPHVLILQGRSVRTAELSNANVRTVLYKYRAVVVTTARP